MMTSFCIGSALVIVFALGFMLRWNHRQKGRTSSFEDVWLSTRDEGSGQAGPLLGMPLSEEKGLPVMPSASEVRQCWTELQ